MTWLYPDSWRSAAGSWLSTRRDTAPLPGTTFLCGVRIVSGHLAGETRRWTFRQSAADELVTDGVVTIQHGTRSRLRLRLTSHEVAPGRRPHHAIVTASELDSAAVLEVSLPAGELVRFGIDGL